MMGDGWQVDVLDGGFLHGVCTVAALSDEGFWWFVVDGRQRRELVEELV